jgi:DnaJ-class molecular chaperone
LTIYHQAEAGGQSRPERSETINYRYFVPTPQTAEDLKSQYRKLAFQHHPDRGGSNEAMKQVNNEYDALWSKLKDKHRTKDGETYEARQATTETADQFKDLIAELMTMDGIIIEVIGCFVWVTGDTKPNKDRCPFSRKVSVGLSMMCYKI